MSLLQHIPASWSSGTAEDILRALKLAGWPLPLSALRRASGAGWLRFLLALDRLLRQGRLRRIIDGHTIAYALPRLSLPPPRPARRVRTSSPKIREQHHQHPPRRDAPLTLVERPTTPEPPPARARPSTPPRLTLVRSTEQPPPPAPAPSLPEPTPKQTRTRIDWSQWDHLLGTMTDQDLADRIGCGNNAVWSRRHKLQIDRFCKSGRSRKRQRRQKVDWDAAAPLLGTMPDAELGRRLGVSRERVRQVRKAHGIPKHCTCNKEA